jgi:quercetin dioxygenase-like cupin family protein
MISKVERAEASPTAALLGRLSGAFGLTLSALLARAEGANGRLARRGDQPQWSDPETHYRRRVVSPATGGPLEIVEVELPAGAEVRFPASAYTFRYHQILVLSGTLTLGEGGIEHVLAKGDCLELGPPAPVTYANRTQRACVYLVALVRV